ncbi:RNA polymerase sigma-70 factor [Sphingobacterium sp. UT-1RO-CII-1]|uniref:RNA polymerase sigma-70 factor n=1 Tax=Sphingobacterium sp. UT-1RO-CII-1 TaxID=2995225 RepID=UPI00227B3F3F|nr:RNA polymerase sigma-70 factor [Sphingobacterium sp. UT-1RO-CII-1]MCY4778108.1 RNA polymerase sigma-70 factor [Sphingobacterium sp. UT-1RO-CII-1]
MLPKSKTEFDVLYRETYPFLYLHAFKMLGDRETAKDVVQEVFTHTWSKRADIVVKKSIRAYLVQAVKNKILDIYAHEATVRKFESTIDYGAYQLIHDAAAREELLMRQIENEIKTLPEQMAIVFRMSRMEEKSHAEIAETLNISVNTVKTHIGRALKKLRIKFVHFFL